VHLTVLQAAGLPIKELGAGAGYTNKTIAALRA
jgi:hypothetical protein